MILGALLLPVMTTFISLPPDPGCLQPLLASLVCFQLLAQMVHPLYTPSCLSPPFLLFPLTCSLSSLFCLSLARWLYLSLYISPHVRLPFVCFSFPIFLPLRLILHFSWSHSTFYVTSSLPGPVYCVWIT